MAKKIGRREFVKKSAKIGITAVLGTGVVSQIIEGSVRVFEGEHIDIGVVTGSDYYSSTIKAVDLIGGIKRFVPKDSRVAILPNVQRWHPGTYTKPEIVRSVINMCKEAGAKEINCLSWLDRKNWEATGLAAVIKEEGANLKLVEREETFFKPVKIPKGKALKEAWIMKEFFNNDVFINMPITKDHAGNKFTGTMKNLMGLNFSTSNRSFHKKDWQTDKNAIEHLDQCIADLNTVIKPTLCVVDATEFIITNGPMGPGEIIKPQKVVVGVDRVAVDSYCKTLWGIKDEEIFMIKFGYEHGLGEMDLNKIKIKEKKI